MIRSRDLVVFVCIVLFLMFGIALTLMLKSNPALLVSDGISFDTQHHTATTTFSAVDTSPKVDRHDTISRLRALLEGGEVALIENPSVESIALQEAYTDVTADSEGSATTIVNRCSEADDSLLYARTWPLRDVRIVVEDGVRSVVYASTEAVSVDITAASSSLPTQKVVATTLLTMRAFPVVQSNTTCLPSDVIGVTVEGALLFNTDAQAYVDRGPETLIGYARDGFPIYGVYTGAVDLCGGYQHIQGYRYTLSPERPFILGCYVGVPSSFTGG